MKKINKRINRILVSKELLPVRDAAQGGDLDAMMTLACHVIENDKTVASVDHLRYLAEAIASHPQLEENVPAIIELCKLMADHYYLLFERGSLTVEECREKMRGQYQELIFWSSQLEFDQWDLLSMKNCMDWLVAEAFDSD